MRAREPAFNIPPVIVACGAALIGVHLMRLPLSADTDFRLLLSFGFIPARYGVSAAFIPGGVGARFWTPLTYAFFHGDLVHLSVNILWLAAFGSAVARRFGAARFVVLAGVSTVAGAAAHYMAMADNQAVMIGASAAISGMTAAAARFCFEPGGPLSGFGRYDQSYRLPAPSLAATFANPRALIFMAVWFGINLLFGVNSAILPGVEAPIAWQAHVGGFIAGLLLFGPLDPVPQPDDSDRAPRDDGGRMQL